MQEKTLLKIALAAGIAGLCGLYLASLQMELPVFEGKDISLIGKNVKVLGKVTRIMNDEKIVLLDVREEKYGNIIPVVIFRREGENISANEGSRVELQGEVREFRGKMEVLASRISLI